MVGNLRSADPRTQRGVGTIPVTPIYPPLALKKRKEAVTHIFSLRSSALEASTLQYLSSHFNDGTTSVFAPPNDEASFIIQIVANKYNPVNFWRVPVHPSQTTSRAVDD